MVLQGVFFMAFLAIGLVIVRLWRLRDAHRFPGCGWWILGCAGIGLASVLSAVSPVVGEWARTLAAHVCLVGGFCAIWIGTRLFLGGRPNRFVIPFFMIFLLFLSVVFFWFWRVNPLYQIRLTINCLFLVLFSFAISQSLFAANIRSGVVTVSGVLYMVFALINGFRTINIIIFPVPESLFLSNLVSRNLTVAMIPVLFAALVTFEFMIRDRVSLPPENDE